MSLPNGGSGGGSGSFLDQRLARRRRMLQMVMRRFGDVETYARARNSSGGPRAGSENPVF